MSTKSVMGTTATGRAYSPQCPCSATRMLCAYLDESGIHATSEATAVIAAVGAPAGWAKFDVEWQSFLQDVGINAWHHRDFSSRRKGYGSLTESQWIEAGHRLCQILIDAQFFIAGSSIGRQIYDKARAEGKWILPADPYKFCLERCLGQVTKQIYASYRDEGICIYYDAAKQHGRIARELLRWHKETFEPSYLSQHKDRRIDIEFGDGGIKSGRAVPDIIAFEACEYVRANTGIPFLGAKVIDGPTPEPRPIIVKLFESRRVPLAVTTYTDWYLDFDLAHAGDRIGEVPPRRISWD